MIVLHCPECESTKLTRYEGKMTENGHDWFHCNYCNKNFTFRYATYSEEADMFE